MQIVAMTNPATVGFMVQALVGVKRIAGRPTASSQLQLCK